MTILERARQFFLEDARLLERHLFHHTALEPDAGGYVHPPYAFAPRPDASAAQLYAPELMARHLDALAQR